MKLNIFNTVICIFINIAHVIFTNVIYADNQTIQVYSSYQFIDLLTNTVNFKKDVIMIYKKIRLSADNVIITHNKMYNISMIKAFGNPVSINYILDTDNIIYARSLVMHYDFGNNIVKFLGCACIEKSGTSIQGDDIIYLINEKKIQAFAKEKEKIVTILSI